MTRIKKNALRRAQRVRGQAPGIRCGIADRFSAAGVTLVKHTRQGVRQIDIPRAHLNAVFDTRIMFTVADVYLDWRLQSRGGLGVRDAFHPTELIVRHDKLTLSSTLDIPRTIHKATLLQGCV